MSQITLTRKDAVATALTALAVLSFAATHQGWNVALVGDSHRWAAVAVALLGLGACTLGEGSGPGVRRLLAALGAAAAALAVLAVATGSLTALSLLVVDVVALWALSTLRHLRRSPRLTPTH